MVVVLGRLRHLIQRIRGFVEKCGCVGFCTNCGLGNGQGHLHWLWVLASLEQWTCTAILG